MITHRDIIHDKPYCKGIITYTAPKMNLQKVSFFCFLLHKATGEHFNKPGHKISDMLMTIIEKVHSDDPMVLSVREEHWIKRGNTKYRGINRNKG